MTRLVWLNAFRVGAAAMTTYLYGSSGGRCSRKPPPLEQLTVLDNVDPGQRRYENEYTLQRCLFLDS